MYDFHTSSIRNCSVKNEKPMTLSAMLFAVLIILILTSVLQSTVLLSAFAFSSFGEIYEVISTESSVEKVVEEISYIYAEFAESDLCIILQLFSTAATIVLTLVLCFCIQKRGLASLAIFRKGAAKHYLLGLLLGALLFALSYGITLMNGSMKLVGVASPIKIGTLFVIFLGYVVQAASEELLFRGFFTCDLVRRGSPVSAVFLGSLVFAFAHASNTGIGFVALLNVFLFGVIASILVLRTGSLIGACALHTAWNFTQGHVFGCRVSGLLTDSTIFNTETNSAMSLTNGGDFGPEGGLAVTIVFLVVLVLLLILPSRQKEDAQR